MKFYSLYLKYLFKCIKLEYENKKLKDKIEDLLIERI